MSYLLEIIFDETKPMIVGRIAIRIIMTTTAVAQPLPPFFLLEF